VGAILALVHAQRLLPALFVALLAAAPAATAAPNLPAERQHAQVVNRQVAAINARLERTVQEWDGARVQLGSVDNALRVNEARLRIARANLGAAQLRVERRLVDLYVTPSRTTAEVIVGATSISDLVDRLEATHVLTAQDSAIAQQAQLFQQQVRHRQQLLSRQRRLRARTLATLNERRRTIATNLARERRLLASIHQTLQTLEAQQAARQRRIAALARARIARQVAVAKQRAAAAAVTPTASPMLAAPAADPPQAPPPAAPASPAPAPPTAPAPPAAPTPPAAPAPPPPVISPAPAPSMHADAASIAARYLGVPYVWGGSSPAGFDCSGLVSYVYAQLGVSLPHYTVAQWGATTPISASDLQPGDLVFFDGLGHVGIYIGAGQFIHAPHTGTVVQIASLSGYWATHLDGARRVP
jgi:cell wall-associated NlpC family hydrolase